ncbi:MAG: endo-1,4-beta-xylanase [Candidatus Sumerlaeota bacterium]|nr:endo-1,4-beta-xylanase [Candidatus Sumerlaeota bacterium]
MRRLAGFMALAHIVICLGMLALAPSAPAAENQNALTIAAEKAAVKTEGGPFAGGGWNLWSNGRVGQPVRIASAGKYQIVVRAWGSAAGGVWPEMALLIDNLSVKTVIVGSAERKDYDFDADLSAGTHEIAAAFLNDEMIGNEDRNLYLEKITIVAPAGSAAPTLTDDKEILDAAEKRESEIVAATAAAIEKNRKSDAVVRVVDAAGKPIADAKVSITQTGHEFLFGSNIYGFDKAGSDAKNAAYKKRFEELLNYATVGFYWRWYEAQRGKPNYEYTDKVVAWCAERGIRMKGHPLLWGDKAGIPPWSEGQPAPELQRQRVEDILKRYHGKIGFWEVVNEPSHLSLPKIDEPYRWARQADPSAYLIVNDYYVMADGAPKFVQLLTEAQKNDVPFDGIGIQAHEPRTMRFPLERVQAVLDRYAALGKELHITEYTPTSGGEKITGSHRTGVWDEAAQADYAVKFYRVCFAHPAMRAITWWDLSDQSSWLKGGGMLRADMSPKPVYDELKRLIHQEWMTRLAGATDADGRFAFRGFRGAYQITVEAQGKKAEKQFQLKKDAGQEITVSLEPR